MNNMDQILYKFIKLDLTQFATFETPTAAISNTYELSTSFRFSYDFKTDEVCCTTTVLITDGKNPHLKAELNSYFKLETSSVIALSKDEILTLPTGLMAQFASLCYGSLRGVIYVKTINTPLNNIILPPSDLQNLFTTPAKLKKLQSSQ